MPVGLPPTFFSIHPLTRYIGNSSRNKLIVFADGTYLELFSWIDTPREFHAWANKIPGFIDFALTSMPPTTAKSLHNHVASRLRDAKGDDELDLSYTLPEAGGRSKPDGLQVKWETSRPASSKSVHRTDFPFFCHDITPRTIRVPFEDSVVTKHPCGATGVSAVEVLVPKLDFDKYTELYELILGVPSKVLEEGRTFKRSYLEVGLPHSETFAVSSIILRSDDEEFDSMLLRNRGTGIRALALSVAGRDGHGKETIVSGENGPILSLKW